MTDPFNKFAEKMNYFKGEFLNADDFAIEQKYHEDLLNKHNLNIYGYGIVKGLEVTQKSGSTVSIAPGMAIDSLGRELILEQGVDVTPARPQFIGIKYVEKDGAKEKNDQGFTGIQRINVGIEICFYNADDNNAVPLIEITQIKPLQMNTDVRKYINPAVPGNLTVGKDIKGYDQKQTAELTVNGSLQVTEESSIKDLNADGDVTLGHDDKSVLIIKGKTASGNTSKRLEINSSMEVVGEIKTTEGIKFSDNSIQNTAVKIQIDSCELPGIPLKPIPIQFKIPFDNPPNIFLSILKLQITDTGFQYSVYTENISTKGFDLCVDCKDAVPGKISWLAISQ